MASMTVGSVTKDSSSSRPVPSSWRTVSCVSISSISRFFSAAGVAEVGAVFGSSALAAASTTASASSTWKVRDLRLPPVNHVGPSTSAIFRRRIAEVFLSRTISVTSTEVPKPQPRFKSPPSSAMNSYVPGRRHATAVIVDPQVKESPPAATSGSPAGAPVAASTSALFQRAQDMSRGAAPLPYDVAPTDTAARTPHSVHTPFPSMGASGQTSNRARPWRR